MMAFPRVEAFVGCLAVVVALQCGLGGSLAFGDGVAVPCGGAWMWDSKEACEERECVWKPSTKTLNWCVYNSSHTETIKHVHVVQGCHFDAGFVDTVDAIVRRWFGFFDQAYHTGMQLEQNSTDPDAQLRFTAQSWVAWLYLNCPADLNLTCPDEAALRRFNTSVTKGWITWQAFPFDAELELLSPTTLRLAFELTHALDAHFGLPPKRVLSQRDVPGIPRAALQPLASSGIHAVSVGTNGGSTPPNVPRVFLWRDKQTATDMLTMYLTGGYGGFSKLPGVFVPTVVPGSNHAMVVAWRGDNSGPPSAKQVQNDLVAVRREFPNARVRVSSFDEFVAAIDTDKVRALLPVITSEIGDTWIHGVASDTEKLAQTTAIQRGIDAWCADAGNTAQATEKSGKSLVQQQQQQSHVGAREAALHAGSVAGGREGMCVFTNPEITTFVHRFLKNSEHTWGLDVKSTLSPRSVLRSNYSNAGFRRARRDNPQFGVLEASWARQRQWGIANALKHLHNSALRQHVERELAVVTSTRVDLNEYDRRDAEKMAVLTAGTWRVLVNTTSTSIISITRNDTSVLGAAASLGSMEYRTYSAENYTHFMLHYNYAGPLFPIDDLDDFDKVGINKAPARYREVGSVGNATSYTRGTTSVVVPSQLSSSDAVTEAGGFTRAWTNYTLLHANATHVRLRAEITLRNKTATRLPEALYVRFLLPSLCGHNDDHSSGGLGASGRWVLTNLRSHTLDPLDVVDGGAKHNHVVSSFACTSPGVRVEVQPSTSPLVSVGEPTAFPTPVRGRVVDPKQGVALIVLNNIWNTNYRMWQEGDLRVAFDMIVSATF